MQSANHFIGTDFEFGTKCNIYLEGIVVIFFLILLISEIGRSRATIWQNVLF